MIRILARTLARTLVSLMAVLIFSSTANANNHDKKLLAQVLTYHNKHADCSYKNDELSSDDMMVLNQDTKVVMVLCLTGAYQGSAVFYMADTQSSQAYIWQLNFATTQDGKMFGATDSLTSPEFDAKTKTISSFYKARGMGDCGSTATYAWNGDSFYLQQAGYMPCCSRPGEAEENLLCKVFIKKQQQTNEEYPVIYQYRKN